MATRRKKCEGRCETWFVNSPELADLCKGVCKDRPSITRDDLLCSGRYISEYDFMARYGYDPCPSSGMTLDDFLALQRKAPTTLPPETPLPDAGGQEGNEATTTASGSSMVNYALIAIGIIAAGLVLVFVLKKSK